MNHCSFSHCSAKGRNAAFGNAICIAYSNISIEMNQFLLSAPNNDNTGDSLVSFLYSATAAKFLNSTSCCGVEGAASISCWNSHIDQTVYEYFNIVDGADWCSLEVAILNRADIHYFNFVNSTKVTNNTINNDRAQELNIYYSIFIKSTSRPFCFVNTKVNLHNCFSDAQVNGLTPTVSSDIATLSFRVDFNFNECSLLITEKQKSYFYIPPSYFFVILS